MFPTAPGTLTEDQICPVGYAGYHVGSDLSYDKIIPRKRERSAINSISMQDVSRMDVVSSSYNPG